MFLILVEFALVLLIFVFFLMQIIIPLWNGTLLFPTFRGKARKLEHEMRQVKSDLELTQQERDLNEQKKRLAELQKNDNNLKGEQECSK